MFSVMSDLTVTVCARKLPLNAAISSGEMPSCAAAVACDAPPKVETCGASCCQLETTLSGEHRLRATRSHQEAPVF